MTSGVNTARRVVSHLRPFSFSRWRRRPPLLAHVTIFAIAIIVPALLFSAFLILRFSQQQAEIAHAQVSDTAEILSDSIDRELLTMITLAKALAATAVVENGDLDQFTASARTALAVAGTDALLIDPALRIAADTRPASARPPQRSTEAEAVQSVFQSRRPLVTNVFHSARSDDIVFQVAVPVIRGDRVIYVLTLVRSTTDLGTFVEDRNLPETWSAVVVDSERHRVVAALATDGKMRPSGNVAFDNPSSDYPFDPTTHDDLIKASHISALSGWTTAVAVPDSVIGQPITRSWWLLIGAVLLLLTFSAALAALFGRRLVVPIQALAHQADAIGKGEPAPPVRTDIAEIGDVSRVLAQASRERREAEEQSRFLMREMTHRAKNQYALIAAIARRAAKESANTSEFLDTLSEALSSLARSADLLAGRGWESVMLADLVRGQLKAFGAGSSGQFVISGPDVRLNPTAAQTIGLALHELATNAAKYGALSVPDGHVRIVWSQTEEFELNWREVDGPPVQRPTRSGFGTLVVQKMTSRGLGGTVDMDYARSGVVWKLRCPVESVTTH
ncbi:sensor histidine kinase [Aureimonas psammosilenae]|uniref:sensor histidine kinase n=1 Tax=Aureimonas psammosilenae TaxID=2495496 RepID=UPI001261320F|nr:HWE histidine kinase domain-containing protein [Aureimonas psammosilenae]